MKRNLGLIGMLICSAGLLALPAAAQERGNRANRTNHDTRQYGSPAYSQSYDQRPTQSRDSYSAYGFENEHNDRGNRDREWRPARHHHERRESRYDNWDWR